MSFLPRADIGVTGDFVNDLWGWTDPVTGKEWALVGHTTGTSFVDLSDPENPVFAGLLPMTEGSQESVWRDIKVYRDQLTLTFSGGTIILDRRELGLDPGNPDGETGPVTGAHPVAYTVDGAAIPPSGVSSPRSSENTPGG